MPSIRTFADPVEDCVTVRIPKEYRMYSFEVVLVPFQATDRTLMYTRAVVIGEIRKGIVRMPQGPRWNLLERWLERYRMNYVQRIVPFDADVAF